MSQILAMLTSYGTPGECLYGRPIVLQAEAERRMLSGLMKREPKVRVAAL